MLAILINIKVELTWSDSHQALISQFSLLAGFLIVKMPVKEKDNKILMLVNLNLDI
jgi:activator of HSP90 ATPase